MNKTNHYDDAVIVAMGSSLAGEFPSRKVLLETAVSRFPAVGLPVVDRSGWWRSAAWPDPAAPHYLNGVVLVETSLAPRSILAALLNLEIEFGRLRGAPNAPRTLDLDLIAHGRSILREPGLSLPHPRAMERLFVMAPLAQIAPDWRHPLSNRTAAELAASATLGAASILPELGKP